MTVGGDQRGDRWDDLLPLPRGITGFVGSGDVAASRVDARAARAAVASMLAGRALELELDDEHAVRSFHDVRVRRHREGASRLLVHRTHPWIAVVAADAPDATLRFIAAPRDLADPPEPFLLVPVSLLERPIEREALSLLAPAERAQVEYWSPTRLGDVVFQYWD